MTMKEDNQLSAYEVYKICQVIDALLASDSPIRDICALAGRKGSPNVSVLERYAGTVLHDAGARELASLAPKLTMMLSRTGEQRYVKVMCIRPPDEATGLLVNIEAALNRLGALADALEAALVRAQRVRNGYRIGISWAGTSFLLDSSKFDGVYATPPEPAVPHVPDMQFLNELDWRVVEAPGHISPARGIAGPGAGRSHALLPHLDHHGKVFA